MNIIKVVAEVTYGFTKGLVYIFGLAIIVLILAHSCLPDVGAKELQDVRINPNNDRTIEGMQWPGDGEDPGAWIYMDREYIYVESDPRETDRIVADLVECQANNDYAHLMIQYLKDKEDPYWNDLIEVWKDRIQICR